MNCYIQLQIHHCVFTFTNEVEIQIETLVVFGTLYKGSGFNKIASIGDETKISKES